MKKIAVAILSVAMIVSSMSVQAKSSTGKTLAWLAAGAVAGYAIKSAMGDNNQSSQYQNNREVQYQDSDGCIVKVSKQRLDNGDIQEVHVKQCRNSQNYNY